MRGASFDHLVGEREQSVRYLEPERLGSLDVDHQLESARLDDGQVRGSRTFENAAGISADLLYQLGSVAIVADQSAGRNELAPFVHGRDRMTGRQGHQSLAYHLEPGVGSVDNSAGLAFDHGREGCVDLALVRCIENEDVLPDRPGSSDHLVNLEGTSNTARVDDECN